MMVAAGCDMPASLRLSSGATGSEKLILECEALAGQIEQGANILEAGQFCKTIPRLFLYSIQLGTQRNELQDNLYSLGQITMKKPTGLALSKLVSKLETGSRILDKNDPPTAGFEWNPALLGRVSRTSVDTSIDNLKRETNKSKG